MSLLKPVTYDGQFQRKVSVGDTLGAAEAIFPVATVGSTVLTALAFSFNIINRSGSTAGYGDTTDSATNIINAVMPVQQGDSWRVKIINSVAFADTLVAGTGVTLVNGTINASSVKEFLVQCTNPTPASIANGITVSGSAVVTGMTLAQTSLITPGMLVTGTGITGGTTVASVQAGTGVTLSANATATSSTGVALTFAPTVTITGLGQSLL